MLLLTIILAVLAYFLYFRKTENWVPFMELPYGDWKTTPEPPAFYALPRYREPYNYPARFTTSYPVKHCATLG